MGHFILRLNQINLNTLTVPCKKSEITSVTSSAIKHIALFNALSSLPEKLACCIAFGSASKVSCLLKIYC